MFDNLKAFLTELSGSEPKKAFGDDDYRLAAVALVINIAKIDGKADEAERNRLTNLIEERFGLDAAATAELIAEGEESDREAIDFFQFTSVLKRRLDEEGRANIVEMMWDIALVDGKIDEFEESTIGRIAELLDISNNDRVQARQRAARDSVAKDSA
ncbi:TerB family tellurite resistance protein [Methylocapsa palsarum]|uniref:Uncharacterized conserved protein, tellurite resistance protein B (TerB) family n=1 Tax=Methylocapsa palsarum TaxID=1612308 RepID=A0A1I3Z5U0_9HYPH|nr:TerB family tellurite resistance protein [Methylocapsa palsarum]SFK39413.1 Uncharacterized conserved protein, tellurite resistance protein B (TerB) family [Methylocapsa palsarum]